MIISIEFITAIIVCINRKLLTVKVEGSLIARGLNDSFDVVASDLFESSDEEYKMSFWPKSTSSKKEPVYVLTNNDMNSGNIDWHASR